MAKNINHPTKNQAKVCYYYMPSRNQKPAEVISVLNSGGWCIRVPVREEDIELYAFFHRDMTEAETAKFGKKQTWRIFTSWEEMLTDHQQNAVNEEVLAALNAFKAKFTLSEEVAA
ncbi:hypothetical protein [Pontibacter sp. SGAir0037]|uniref:hypothetical protein n=1 Tax=Pontibacter sp. SGAir0037 TaxID=2571030 RepID=UPI0010CD024D|nr:hypothetical protein [Pontibacter sp. SGAir0037]QCR24475.1 hypothetical protein C1N53_20355 [Pontibacter sp. SGAir0037]